MTPHRIFPLLLLIASLGGCTSTPQLTRASLALPVGKAPDLTVTVLDPQSGEARKLVFLGSDRVGTISAEAKGDGVLVQWTADSHAVHEHHAPIRGDGRWTLNRDGTVTPGQ